MNLLVIGGTQFVGRAIAEAALDAGHELTLFNRGRTNPGLFPQAEHVRGDRERDLSALAGRTFDAVVDTSGYVPRVVRESVRALADAAPHYCFVSTVSVYADFSTAPAEDARLRKWDGTNENVQEAYGELKAACEHVVRDVVGDRALIVRPGIIAGPHDPTYRFTYWVERLAEGGDVLAPEPRDAPVQVIDARDLGDWIVRCAEARLTGVYNAAGPAEPLTMEGLLETCRTATGGRARLRWVDADFLARRAVNLPLWIADPAQRSIFEVDSSRAFAAGLRLRPLARTVRDTLAWVRSGAETFARGGVAPGLDPRREAALIAEAA